MIDLIMSDIKTAMRAKDTDKLKTLRALMAEAKNIAIADKRKDVTEDDYMSALTKAIKQRNDSIKDFSDAGRDDLVKIEEYEKNVLSSYLPSQLTEAEVGAIVDEAISATGATTKKEMGKVMGAVMKNIEKGTVDNKLVSKIVGSKLS